MSFTVKQISENFSYLKPDDLKYLTGKSDVKGDDTVILSKLAATNKKDIQIFAAKKEGNPFLDLLKGDRKVEVTKVSGVSPVRNNASNPFAVDSGHQKQNPALQAYIPAERKAWIG
ncbi:MAG: hypothetical protein NC191_06025 [Muribaculaceae bacterium]|nr:hypothetical protein [Muribaculaceae bacterium]